MNKFKSMCLLVAGMAAALVSCKPEAGTLQDELKVTPGRPVTFEAENPEPVTFEVTTTAASWDCECPSWVTSEKKGNELVLTAETNTGSARTGELKVTAGNAEPVTVLLKQRKGETVTVNVTARFTAENGYQSQDLFIAPNDETNHELVLKYTLDSEFTEDASISVKVNDSYNYASGQNELPQEALATSLPLDMTIVKGQTEVTATVSIDASKLETSKRYVLPLIATSAAGNSENIDFQNNKVVYNITKSAQKDVKQLVCLEINDTNPLNLLEYKLEDGTYFVDAVVLFSGNIGWDAATQRGWFNKRTGEDVINGNIEHVVNEWETYLQPLHDAGIKVYMGLMPHHTALGFFTMSEYGCKTLATDIATMIRDCRMDGVFLDEEYCYEGGKGDLSSEWGSNPKNGNYFAYTIDKKMEELIPEYETDVVIYNYGWGTIGEDITEGGVTSTTPDYIDIVMNNYSASSDVPAGLTKKNVTGHSTELAQNGWCDEATARTVKDGGYGWMAWFGWNADETSPQYRSESKFSFRNVAKGCYGQDLQEPQYYYKKTKNSDGAFYPDKFPCTKDFIK